MAVKHADFKNQSARLACSCGSVGPQPAGLLVVQDGCGKSDRVAAAHDFAESRLDVVQSPRAQRIVVLDPVSGNRGDSNGAEIAEAVLGNRRVAVLRRGSADFAEPGSGQRRAAAGEVE